MIGKNEKIILKLALENHSRTEYERYPNGVCIDIIAKELYGSERYTCLGQSSTGVLKYSYVASISRSLNNLWKKGLLVKYKPEYKSKWDKEGYMRKRLIGLSLINLPNEYSYGFIPFEDKYIELPNKTKRWYILTEKGKGLITKIQN